MRPISSRRKTLPLPTAEEISTQEGFGRILFDLAREQTEFASRIVTTSPDVTVSTNMGGWVNRRGVFDRTEGADTIQGREDRFHLSLDAGTIGASIWNWASRRTISSSRWRRWACRIRCSASGSFPSARSTIPFIARGLDALNYACYQNARFILVATPSGITLAPEGGAHQSIGTPLIGMAQDGLASFEPAFVDELAEIMRWSFDYMQRDGERTSDPRLAARRDRRLGLFAPLHACRWSSPSARSTTRSQGDIIDGAYWLRPPGPNCEICIAYQGVVAPEAIEAAGFLAEDRNDVAVLAVTSADRLNAGWQAAQRARACAATAPRSSHIERLLADLPAFTGIVTVIDGHPATLSWLGGVRGHRVASLGVEHFGQSGRIAQLYEHYGIDTAGILRAAGALVQGRPIRYLRAI